MRSKYSEFDTELLHFIKYVGEHCGTCVKFHTCEEKKILEMKTNHLMQEYEKHKMQFNPIAMY